MASQATILVRRATKEDYQGVLNITDVFNRGADYIQQDYHKLINDPDSKYYVCEVDGEVVAFDGVALIDDNSTLMSRSSRVKESFQGQGLLSLIRKKIHEDYKDVPGRKRVRSCCANVVRLVDSQTFRSQNRTLTTRALAGYETLDVLSLTNLIREIKPEATELDLEDLAVIFENKELVNFLFPSQIVDIISWFFEPTSSNIRHIQKLKPYISISPTLKDYVELLKSSSKNAHTQKQQLMQPQGLLSFCAHYTNPSMLFLTLDFYGEPRPGREEEDVRDILFHGLQYAVSVVKRDKVKVPVVFGLSTYDTPVIDTFKEVLASLGCAHHGEMGVFNRHYFFEQDFDQLDSEGEKGKL